MRARPVPIRSRRARPRLKRRHLLRIPPALRALSIGQLRRPRNLARHRNVACLTTRIISIILPLTSRPSLPPTQSFAPHAYVHSPLRRSHDGPKAPNPHLLCLRPHPPSQASVRATSQHLPLHNLLQVAALSSLAILWLDTLRHTYFAFLTSMRAVAREFTLSWLLARTASA
jgi:hypothetical protein